MKNPFRRYNEIDKQLATLREISEAMREAANQVAIETSAPMLRRKLAELDPRLLDLIMDQAQYETVFGYNDLQAGSRMRAVTACRFANRTDVQIGNAAQTWTDWGFGRQVDVRAVDDKADAVWQECWTAARNRALFGQRFIHELSHQILTDGELFFIGYASRQDGTTTWRTLRTEQVTAIVHAKDDPAERRHLEHIGADTAADIEHRLAPQRRESQDHFQAAILAETPNIAGVPQANGLVLLRAQYALLADDRHTIAEMGSICQAAQKA